MRRIAIFLLIILVSSLVVSGCEKQGVNEKSGESEASYVVGEEGNILLAGDSISYSGELASVSGSTVTITSGGVFTVRGELSDGQIIVDVDDEEKVYLLLDGVSITCKNGPAIYVKSADETILTLAEGTENIFNDGSEYVLEEGEDEPDACIFSKNDLVIDGNGSLVVSGNFEKGIKSKDDIKILDGNISITSKDDALLGRDSVTVKNGTILIESEADGIKTTNDSSSEKGYCDIEGGDIIINSENDGIDIVSDLTISGGKLSVKSGGGYDSALSKSDDSRKGLKADNSITIMSGAEISLDSIDDAINSANTIIFNGGYCEIYSGDDAVKADNTLTVIRGNIYIYECYEGLESEQIVLNGGVVEIKSESDGINCSLDEDKSSKASLKISGGQTKINAGGDGIDVNGSIIQTGGDVVIFGPLLNNNSAIDFDNTYSINGGTMIAFGSSGMAQGPTDGSPQCSALVFFETKQSGNKLFALYDSSGNNIVSVVPLKDYKSVVVSSPDVMVEKEYVIKVDGEEILTFKQSSRTLSIK